MIPDKINEIATFGRGPGGIEQYNSLIPLLLSVRPHRAKGAMYQGNYDHKRSNKFGMNTSRY